MPTIWDVSPPCDGAEMMDDQIPLPLTVGVWSYLGWSVESGEKQEKAQKSLTIMRSSEHPYW